jgi:hypothetical protein
MSDFARLVLAADTTQMVQAGAALDGVATSGAKAEAAAKRVGTATATAGRQAQVAGGQIRGAGMHTANLGAQFNDIGVMLASGQSPLMLAMQQGTQINQVFDQMAGGGSRLKALGAAFISIISPANLLTIGIIAGGAALAQWGLRAMQAGEDSRDLEEIMDDLSMSVRDYTRAVDNSQGSLRTMIESYGEAAAAAGQLLEAQQNLARFDAAAALNEAVQSITVSFGDLSSVSEESFQRIANRGQFILETYAELQEAQAAGNAERVRELTEEVIAIGQLPSLVADVASEYAITTAQAQGLVVAVREFQQASTFAEQADAAAVLAQQLFDATDGLETASDETEALYRSLLEAGGAAATLAGTDMAGPIGAAAGAAGVLAGNLSAALAIAQAISRENAQDAYNVPAGRGGDPRSFGSDYASVFNQPGDSQTIFPQSGMTRPGVRPELRTGIDFGMGPTGAGGGGGGANQIDAAEQAYSRLIASLDPVVAATQELADAQEVVNNALAAGVITQEQAATAMALATEQYDEAIGRANELNEAAEAGVDVFSRMFEAIGQGGDAVKQVLADLLAQLAQIAFSDGLSALAGMGGGIGSIFETIGSMFIPKYATGTSNHPGGPAIINEAGGELVSLPSGSTVIPHDLSKQMVGQMSADVTSSSLTLTDDGRIMADLTLRIQRGMQQAVKTVSTEMARNPAFGRPT